MSDISWLNDLIGKENIDEYNPVESCSLSDKYCNLHFYEFYGCDYLELCWCWNMQADDDEIAIEQIELVIEKCYNSEFLIGHNFFPKKALKDMRLFVKSLIPGSGYYSPVWKGLSEVESDTAFLQIFHSLLKQAWT